MAGTAENEPTAYTYTLFVENQAPGQGVSVTGRLPREFLVSVGSEWQGNAAGETLKEIAEAVGGQVEGAIGSTIAGGYVTVSGANLAFTALANRQWTGSNPLTFNLLAEFVAENNAVDDVLRPTLFLQSMSMATTIANSPNMSLPEGLGSVNLGGVIGAPYWQQLQSSGQVGGKSMIKLRIGELFLFDDMIVENVALNYSMQLVAPGVPNKVTAEIQVATRGPITFEQYVSYMTGAATQDLFNGNDRISAARQEGGTTKAGFSRLEPTSPTK